MAGRLEGKVCVITGAASGIGAESARLFEQEGATVVGADLSAESFGSLQLQVDVSDEDQVREMYARTRKEFGRIDVLFNNAGINPNDDTSVLDTSVEAWQRVQDVNLKSRVPVLQARDPAPARGGRRLGDQHGLVRRRDGRGRVADLLHGVEGRRCWRCRASWASSSRAAACA